MAGSSHSRLRRGAAWAGRHVVVVAALVAVGMGSAAWMPAAGPPPVREVGGQTVAGQRQHPPSPAPDHSVLVVVPWPVLRDLRAHSGALPVPGGDRPEGRGRGIGIGQPAQDQSRDHRRVR